MAQTYSSMGVDFHLLKRKNAKGKVVYHAAFLDDTLGKNGKRKYRAVKTTRCGNRSAAEKTARQMIAEGSVLAARDTLRDYLIDFWDDGKSEYLKSRRAEGRAHNSVYVRDNRAKMEKYVLPYFEARGIKRLADLNRQNILAWRNHLWEHGKLPVYVPPEPAEDESRRGTRKLPSKLSPSSQNKVRVAFFVALQWAVDIGMLPYHPGQGVRRIKEERQNRPFFELEELATLFDTWSSELGPVEKHTSQTSRLAYAACLLAATTGARMGEVRGLQIRNVHLEDGYLDIVTNYVSGDGLKDHDKAGNTRLGVPLVSRAADALRDLIMLSPFAAREDAFVFFSAGNERQPIDDRVITKELKARMEAAGISGGQTFHSFRHTYISHLRGVVPEAKLRAIVGHSSAETTNRYTHQTAEDRAAIRGAVNGLVPIQTARQDASSTSSTRPSPQ